MTDGALLSVSDLRVEFGTERGTVYAVNGISFEVSNGETLGIVGESGCGKSVTSLALLGLLARTGRVTSGEAMFDGRDLLQMADGDLRKIRGKDIAMIFQDPMSSLNPVLTVGRSDSRGVDDALRPVGEGSRRSRHRASGPGRDPEREVSRIATTRTSSPAECDSGR